MGNLKNFVRGLLCIRNLFLNKHQKHLEAQNLCFYITRKTKFHSYFQYYLHFEKVIKR